jgi:hypothetical protein
LSSVTLDLGGIIMNQLIRFFLMMLTSIAILIPTTALARKKITPIVETLYQEGEIITVRGKLVGRYSKISVFQDGRAENLWVFFIDENPEDKRMLKFRTHILILFKSDDDIKKLDLTKPVEVTGKPTSRIGQIGVEYFVPGLNLEAGFKQLRIEATEVRQP